MTTPAGWYDDGSGRQRWWDGAQWTEHFADTAAESTPAAEEPVASEAATPAESPVSPETSDAAASDFSTGSIDDTVIRADTSSAAPEPAAGESAAVDAPADAAPAEAYTAPAEAFPAPAESAQPAAGSDLPAYAAPTEPAAAPAQPEAPAYGSAPAYPGAAPAYPGAASSYPGADASYGAAPAQPGAPAYPGAAGGYPAAYPTAPADAPKKLSVVGLVGLGLAALGTIFVFVPVLNVVGFVLLSAGFIVSIVSLFLKGKKWPGITGLALSIVGTIIGIIMVVVFLAGLASDISEGLEDFPSDFPSDIATDPFDEPSDEPLEVTERPTVDEVAVGLSQIIENQGVTGYPDEAITCLAGVFVDSDMSNEGLATIASGDDMLTDPDDATAFAEAFGEGMETCAPQQ